MLRTLSISIAASALLLTAAQAGTDLVRRDVAVSFRQADLSSEAGARAVLAKIDFAAREACGGSPIFYGTYNVAPGLARKDFATCQANAVSAAVKSLNAPLVMRIYAQNGDESLRIAGR